MTTRNQPLRVDLVADMRRRCGLDDPKPEATAEADEALDDPRFGLTDDELSRVAESEQRRGEMRRGLTVEAPPTALRVDLGEDMRRRLAERDWPPAEA